MSHTPSPQESHGSVTSYVIGFILSLIFTAIPYYLVVNKSVPSGTLLIAIMVFAVLQMLVQIIFFLHLGRGPKAMYNLVFFGFTIITILVVVIGSIWIMNHLNYNMTPIQMSDKLIEKEGIHQIAGEETGACKGEYQDHMVTIRSGVVTPAHINAKKCENLVLINEDSKVREIAFGSHPRHDVYSGEYDIPLRKGRAKTIILKETGTYNFHDHFEPAVSGSFTVNQ